MNEKEKIDTIKNSGLSEKAKKAGVLGVVVGADNDSIVNVMMSVMNSEATQEADKQEIAPMPFDYTKTECKIHEMLIENTGINMLDSGGSNNRSWQMNRHIKDFRKKQRMVVDIDNDGQICASLSVFHLLRENLLYDEVAENLTKEMREYSTSNSIYGLQLLEEFISEKLEQNVNTFNTYNGESIVSQVLQGAEFEVGDDQYIALQIHNGCDVRGGYTEPVVFKVLSEYFYFTNDIIASCKCGSVESDDGGYHWYGYEVFPDTKDYSLPIEWKLNKINNKNVYVCDDCGSVVKFG